MKKVFLSLVIISVLCVNSLAQDAAGQKKDPVGKWKFEAATAPEGYTSGTMVFSLTESKYAAGIMFTNFEYKFPGEKVKVVGDSLSFVVSLEGQQIEISLKMENASKMTGKASYPEGNIPLVLTKLPN
jgi:hypothetical protein